MNLSPENTVTTEELWHTMMIFLSLWYCALAIIKSCEEVITQKYGFDPYKEPAADKIVETGQCICKYCSKSCKNRNYKALNYT